MSILSIQDLQIPFSKSGKLPRFSMELSQPSLVFIAGSNGIGKTSFLRMFHTRNDFEGVISLDSIHLKRLSNAEKARRIGFLGQRHAIEFPVPAKELVVMGRYPYKNALAPYTEEDYRLAWHAMEELEITYAFEKNFLTLSGGEQQLCMLAQLSLQDPDLLLLDEPTQSLDLYNKDKVLDWMERQVTKGKTVLCVTHDLPWLSGRKGQLLVFQPKEITRSSLSENTLQKAMHQLRQNDGRPAVG